MNATTIILTLLVETLIYTAGYYEQAMKPLILKLYHSGWLIPCLWATMYLIYLCLN